VGARQLGSMGDDFWGRSDSSGQYSIPGLPSGQYYVYILGPNGWTLDRQAWQIYDQAILQKDASLVSVIAGDTTSGIDFSLPTLGAVEGSVMAADGTTAPVPNIPIIAYDVYGSLVGSAFTDGSGFYSISDLHAGTYFVVAIPAQSNFQMEIYDNVTSLASASPVTVAAGATVSGISFNLPRLDSIRVVDPMNVLAGHTLSVRYELRNNLDQVVQNNNYLQIYTRVDGSANVAESQPVLLQGGSVTVAVNDATAEVVRLWASPDPPGFRPPALYGLAGVLDDYSGRFILYGGMDGRTASSNVYAQDLATGVWTQLLPGGTRRRP
jgi:hypothetical protein